MANTNPPDEEPGPRSSLCAVSVAEWTERTTLKNTRADFQKDLFKSVQLRGQLNTPRTASCGPAELGDEEQSRRGAGDGFHVLLVVAAEVTQQQIVEDAHNAHQQQEAEDPLSK